MTITVEAFVNATLSEVWRAYTTPEDIQQWFTPSPEWHPATATCNLKVGGAFSYRMETWDASSVIKFAGKYTKIVPHERLEYKCGKRRGSIDFIYTGDGDGVEITMTFDPEPDHAIGEQLDRWRAILINFAIYVETNA
jgi:uncharacterized protein YndB with AHSA1/START domain